MAASLLWLGSCSRAAAGPSDGLVLEPFVRSSLSQPLLSMGRGSLRLMPRPGMASGADASPGLVPGANSDLPISAELTLRIGRAAMAYGHEVSLVKAIVRVESAFNPSAISPKGALGLMQIMPAVAADFGIAHPATDLLDPDLNLLTGARYLRMLRERFPGRLDLVIAAYNAGSGAVSRWSGVPPYPETRAYVRAVMDWYARYERQGRLADEMPTAPVAKTRTEQRP